MWAGREGITWVFLSTAAAVLHRARPLMDAADVDVADSLHKRVRWAAANNATVLRPSLIELVHQV